MFTLVGERVCEGKKLKWVYCEMVGVGVGVGGGG